MLSIYNDKIRGEISEQQQRIHTATNRQQECISNVKQAMKTRKIVEKLREKRLLQYQTEMLRDEQKVLDELGLQVFARNG
jgi:flagellar FliJ protein